MCGIAGIVGSHSVDEINCINAMLNTIRHRGPDESNVKKIADGILGHVRLSIIDINGGKQPMSDVSGNLELVFNGEIYGYQDIKKNIASYPYQTESDTEVILALYDKYHDYEKMLSNLPGMFAFGLWDNRMKTLFCARDRMGEKPLYYAIGKKGEFIFASEIKAIIASGLIEPKVDRKALCDYLHHSYIYPTITIYENIFTLPPAHYLLWSNGQIKVKRYWELPKTNENITINEAVEEFRKLFHQAVERQIVADVPVGAFLSGGLDSGSVVAQMAQIVPKVTTISFASTMGYDESPLAYTMAKKYQTNHIVIRDNEQDIVSLLFKMQEIFDEPFADPAAISAYAIAKEARKHVKVILSGDAGDEMLGGYPLAYRSFYYSHKMRASAVPMSIQKSLIDMLSFSMRVFKKINYIVMGDKKRNFGSLEYMDLQARKLGIIIAQDAPNDIKVYHRNRMQKINAVDNLETLGLYESYNDIYIQDGFLEKGEYDNAIRCDLLDYLPGNGLMKTDRTTMAVSLESRTPFCDVDLASFCISLPFRLKVSDRTDKIILRKSMERMWTPEIRNNVKMGFSPPWGKWMNSESVKELLQEYFYNRNAAIWNYLDYGGTVNYFKMAPLWPKWSLLNLSLWFGTR